MEMSPKLVAAIWHYPDTFVEMLPENMPRDEVADLIRDVLRVCINSPQETSLRARAAPPKE